MRYRHIKHPSRLATLAVTFGAGNRVEFGRDYPGGISHFIEHMIFKGTEKYTSKELLKKIAGAGGSWNAWTSENLISVYATIPEENLETAFECLSQVTRHPTFPEPEMLKEHDVVVQEIKMYDDDIDELVHNRTMDLMFENSLSKPILGTEESVRSITRDDLVRFHQEFYGDQQMLITLGSAIDRSDLVEQYFGKPDDQLDFVPPDQNVVYKEAVADSVYKEAQIQDHISICYGGQAIKDLTNEREKLKVFSVIFGSGDTSRLFMRVREDMGLVYGISASGCNYMDGALYSINTSTEPKNKEAVMTAINEEIEKIRQEPPTEKELDTAKNIIRSAVYRMLDTSAALSLQTIYEEYFDYRVGDEFLAKIDEVSVQDVQDIANIIFNENKYVVIGTGENG